MAQAAEKTKPRLKNLDELFRLHGDKLQDQPIPDTHKPLNLLMLDIEGLRPFHKHPFRIYDGERLEDMVDSIKANGVLVPIIVRFKDNAYEILSGHNRVNAARQAGLKNIPAVVKVDISDDEALIYVIETNLMQRSFADMTHSEKAAVIAMQHSKLFSQGKRNDILAELNMLENPHEYSENGTCAQVGQKLEWRDVVAKEYSLSRNTVARYLRIHQLDPAIKNLLDNGVIAFIPAVTLSFLKEDEQRELVRCVELNNFTVDMKKADMLRTYSEKGKLDDERIYLILNGEIGHKPKPNRTPTVKVSKAVYAKYFRSDQSAKEVQETVEKALTLYFSQE